MRQLSVRSELRPLDVTKFADSPPASQPAAEAPVGPTLSAVASDTEPQVADPVGGGSEVSSKGSDDLLTHRHLTTQEPVGAADDHHLALLPAMFVFLATAGSIVHYFERRRRKRAARGFEPPQWAPVVTIKTADPGALIPLPSGAEIGKRLLPPPPASANQTERLTNALQQLLDRLQTELNLERQAMRKAAWHAHLRGDLRG